MFTICDLRGTRNAIVDTGSRWMKSGLEVSALIFYGQNMQYYHICRLSYHYKQEVRGLGLKCINEAVEIDQPLVRNMKESNRNTGLTKSVNLLRLTNPQASFADKIPSCRDFDF